MKAMLEVVVDIDKLVIQQYGRIAEDLISR